MKKFIIFLFCCYPIFLLTQTENNSAKYPKAGKLYAILSLNSHLALDVAGGSKENGANVQQYSPHYGDNQLWAFEYVGLRDGYRTYRINSVNSGKCLDVYMRGMHDGANVQQWACHMGENQLWKLVPSDATANFFNIVSVGSNKCLDIAGGSRSNGGNLQQYRCHGGYNQLWRLSEYEKPFDVRAEYNGVKSTSGTRPLLVVLLGAKDPSNPRHINTYIRKADGYIYLKTISSPTPDNIVNLQTVKNLALPQNQRFVGDPVSINSADNSRQNVFALGVDGYIYQSYTSVYTDDHEWTPWTKLPGATRFKSGPTAFNTPDGRLLSVLATGQDGYVYQTLYAYSSNSGWQTEWNRLPGATRFKSAPNAINTPDGRLLSVMATGVDGYVYQTLYARGASSRWQQQWNKLPGTTRFKSAPSAFNTPDGSLLSVMATGQDGYVYQTLYNRSSGSNWQRQWHKLPGTQKFISNPWSMNSANGKFAIVFALGEDYKMYQLVYQRGSGSHWRSRWETIDDNERYISAASAIPALFPKKTPQYYDDLIFGPSRSVRTFYAENSYGKFTYTKAMITPWLSTIDDPATPLDESSDEYLGNFDGLPGSLERKSAWIIKLVEQFTSFRFADYDRNGDGKVTEEELAMLWIYPGFNDARGRGISPSLVKVPSLSGASQGVQLGMLIRGGAGMSMETIAHELGHQTLHLHDLYANGREFSGVGQFSLMDVGGRDAGFYRWAKHLDPWSKIKLGWLPPTAITRSGWYLLNAVENHAEAYIIPNPAIDSKEYFILENRWPDGSHEDRLPDRGIAVWHIVERYEGNGNWARNTIRLVSPLNNQKALWDGADLQTAYDLTPYDPDPNHISLKWADGQPVNFSIRWFSASGPLMSMYVDFNDQENSEAISDITSSDLTPISIAQPSDLSDNLKNKFSIYPNPFHNQTNIHLLLPEAEQVDIDIFDLQGRLVRSLLSENLVAGEHQIEWDGKNARGNTLSSGLYLVKFQIGREVKVKKVSLQ